MKRKVFYTFTIIFIITGIFTVYGWSKDMNLDRVSKKPAGTAPLAGMSIKEGVKLALDDNVVLIGFRPEFKVLSVYPNPRTSQDKIIINKSENRLYLYKSGELYATYPVATGKKPQYTPEGNFKIANKIENDRELNPQLGVRWMGLSVPWRNDKRAHNDERAPAGHKYGIHGTNEPDSIGKHVSGGCIRMSNKQVLEIFGLVEEGTPVEIR